MPDIGTGIGMRVNDAGSIKWSSYWATLISATVEDAAPTHVVLTFPTAQTSLGASDFTIAGFTVSSASWTGAVLTLVLSVGVTYYQGDFSVTFAKTGETATVTNNVADDGLTKGWYVFNDLTTITKDENDYISNWANKLDPGTYDLAGVKNPLYTEAGIISDKSNYFIVSGSQAQPTVIYSILKINSWGGIIYAGASYRQQLSMGAVGTLELRGAGAATPVISYNDVSSGSFMVVKTKISTVADSDEILISGGMPVTGEAGNANNLAFVLGAGNNGYQPSDITILEVVYRKAEGDAEEAAILNYMNNKLAFFLT